LQGHFCDAIKGDKTPRLALERAAGAGPGLALGFNTLYFKKIWRSMAEKEPLQQRFVL
jgi:hypothetical protein